MRLHGEKKSVSHEHCINNVTKRDSYFLPRDTPVGTLQESVLRSQLRRSCYIQPWLSCPEKESSRISIRFLFLLILPRNGVWMKTPMGSFHNTYQNYNHWITSPRKELNYIMDQLNHRHRKTLDFKTPYKLSFKKNTSLTVILHTWIRQSIYEKERFWFLLVSHPHSFDKNSKDSDKNTLRAT